MVCECDTAVSHGLTSSAVAHARRVALLNNMIKT